MNKQTATLHEAMDNMSSETAENRRRFIHNSRTKNVEDLQPYDNKAMLEMVSLTKKLSRNWEKEEKVDLEIHYARYGSTAHKRDIISIVEEQISPYQRLNLLINNDTLGGDFYLGKEKQLHIIYTFNGILYEERLNEGEVLSIPKLQIETQKTGMPNGISIILIVLFLVLGIGLTIRELR